ncbi:MAG: sulfotransferase [Bradyrhizobium sp.]
MKASVHFISGLPRAGSTLLSAILRQNPRFHAGMTGPVGSLVEAMLRNMSMSNETSIYISDAQREKLLRAIFATFYDDVPESEVVFDTNRMWCTKLPMLTKLFPKARVICCVRDIPWIFDSIERLIRKNQFQPSGIFAFEPGGTVYSRVEGLGAGNGMVGYAWNALHEAWCGEQADRLLLVRYETLTSKPRETIDAIYQFIGEKPFAHDFENVEFDAAEFDRRLGTPGLHTIGRRVAKVERRSLLPPVIVAKYENDAFWRDPGRNPNNVKVV